MQSGGDADFQYFPQFCPRYGQLPQIQPEDSLLVCQEIHDNGGVDEVRYDGGDGHSCHAHIKDDDQQKVQSYIDEAGNHQTVKRSFRVARASENGGAEIVYHHKRHSDRKDAEVKHGKVNDILRRVQRLQNGFGYQQTDGEQEDAACHGNDGGC